MKDRIRGKSKSQSRFAWVHIVVVSLIIGLASGLLGCSPGAEKTPATTDAPATGEEGSGHLPVAATPSFLSMADERRGFGLTDALVLRTTNGGATWTDVTPESRHDFSIIGPAEFLDGETGWFAATQAGASSVEVFRSVDGGRTWKSVALDVGEAITGVVSLDFVDSMHGRILLAHGVAAGSEAVSLYRTADGGVTWALASKADPRSESGLPLGGLKTGLSFAKEERGWLTGLDYSDVLWLYETPDGGETWEKAQLPVPEGYSTDAGSASTHPPVFFGGEEGFLPVRFGGENPVTVFYVTADGGGTWNPTAPVTHLGGPELAWSFLDPERGFVISGDTFYSTQDGARTWTVVNRAPELEGARQLEFVTSKTGWAAGDDDGRPFLLKTVDGGRTWEPVPTEGRSQGTPRVTENAR